MAHIPVGDMVTVQAVNLLKKFAFNFQSSCSVSHKFQRVLQSICSEVQWGRNFN